MVQGKLTKNSIYNLIRAKTWSHEKKWKWLKGIK